MRKTVVGVMCPGDNAPQSAIKTAYILGKLIAQEGWILLSDALIIIADGMGAGTVSEAALALKAKKTIILLDADEVTKSFFQKLGNDRVEVAKTPQDAIAQVKRLKSLHG